MDISNRSLLCPPLSSFAALFASLIVDYFPSLHYHLRSFLPKLLRREACHFFRCQWPPQGACYCRRGRQDVFRHHWFLNCGSNLTFSKPGDFLPSGFSCRPPQVDVRSCCLRCQNGESFSVRRRGGESSVHSPLPHWSLLTLASRSLLISSYPLQFHTTSSTTNIIPSTTTPPSLTLAGAPHPASVLATVATPQDETSSSLNCQIDDVFHFDGALTKSEVSEQVNE